MEQATEYRNVAKKFYKNRQETESMREAKARKNASKQSQYLCKEGGQLRNQNGDQGDYQKKKTFRNVLLMVMYEMKK